MIIAFLLLPLHLAWAPVSAHAADFSHQRHIEAVGLSCPDCHRLSEDTDNASPSLFPRAEVCVGCHAATGTEECAACATIDRLQDLERPIPGLVFDHRRHLFSPEFTAGKGLPSSPAHDKTEFTEDDCLFCHPGMKTVGIGSPENFPQMSDCLSCHPFKGDPMASCEMCHSEEFNLRPANHLNNEFFDAHSSEESEIDRSECSMCHIREYIPCTQCH